MIELDGIKNGIAILVKYTNNPKPKYIMTRENGIRLFNNLKVAKAVARTVKGIEPKIEYHIVVDGKVYPISKCRKYHGRYKIIDTETNEIITVAEKLSYKASNFSYIVCDNGDTVRCDKKYGSRRVHDLFDDIAGAVELCVIGNLGEFGISTVDRYKSEIVVHLRNCTASVHICTNSNLMDINQCRKEEGDKVFPFSKNMDKYTTFYTYISKDVSEPTRINSEEMAIAMRERIVECLASFDPESNVHLSQVDYNGYVNFIE